MTLQLNANAELQAGTLDGTLAFSNYGCSSLSVECMSIQSF